MVRELITHQVGDRVWQVVARTSFVVLSRVTPAGEPRCSGVAYKASGRRLVVAITTGTWRARHVGAAAVAVTVLVRRNSHNVI